MLLPRSHVSQIMVNDLETIEGALRPSIFIHAFWEFALLLSVLYMNTGLGVQLLLGKFHHLFELLYTILELIGNLLRLEARIDDILRIV